MRIQQPTTYETLLYKKCRSARENIDSHMWITKPLGKKFDDSLGYHNSMSSGFQSIDSSDFTGFHSTYLWSKRLSRQQWHSKFTVETLDIYGIKMYWRWCRISSINSISAFWERSETPTTPPPKSNLTMETPPCMKLYFLLHMDIFQCHVSFQGFKLKRTPFPIIFEWRLSQKDRIQVTVAVPKSILQLFPQWYFF